MGGDPDPRTRTPCDRVQLRDLVCRGAAMKALAGADTAPLHCGFTELAVSSETTAPTTSNHRPLAALAATAVRCLGVA